MSRFNKIEKPEFVDDFLYQPPWELIQKVAQKKQEDFSTTMKSMDILENSLSINYIPDEIEEKRLNSIQKFYQDKIDTFNKTLLEKPEDYKKYLPDMLKLGKEISTDLKTGELSKIQGSYNAYQEWLSSDSVKNAQKNEPGLFERARTKFLSDWQANPNRSQDSLFKGQQLLEGRDFTDGLDKIIKELQPDLQKEGLVDMEGNWIATTTNEEKRLSVDRINNLVMGKLMADPSLREYILQRHSLGYNGYVDSEGNFIPPLNEDGTPNPMSSLAPTFQFGQAFAYDEKSVKQEVKENAFRLDDYRTQNDMAIDNNKSRLKKDELDFEYQLKEFYGIDSGGGSSSVKDMLNLDQPDEIKDELVILNSEFKQARKEKDEAFKTVTRPIYDLLVKKDPSLENAEGRERFSVGSSASMRTMVARAKAKGAITAADEADILNEIRVAERRRDEGYSATGKTALAGAIFHTFANTPKGRTMNEKSLLNKSLKSAGEIIDSYNKKIENPMSMVRDVVRINSAGPTSIDANGKKVATYTMREYRLSELSGKTIDMKINGKLEKVTFPTLEDSSKSYSGSTDPNIKANTSFFAKGSAKPVVVSSNARNTFIQVDVPAKNREGKIINIPVTFKNELEMVIN